MTDAVSIPLEPKWPDLTAAIARLMEDFGEDYFIVYETKVLLSDVYRYDIRDLHNHNFNYRFSSNSLFIAGSLLPLAEWTNQQVSGSGDHTGIHHSVWLGSVSLLMGGIVIRWLEPKYFKPGFKKKATIFSIFMK